MTPICPECGEPVGDELRDAIAHDEWIVHRFGQFLTKLHREHRIILEAYDHLHGLHTGWSIGQGMLIEMHTGDDVCKPCLSISCDEARLMLARDSGDVYLRTAVAASDLACGGMPFWQAWHEASMRLNNDPRLPSWWRQLAEFNYHRKREIETSTIHLNTGSVITGDIRYAADANMVPAGVMFCDRRTRTIYVCEAGRSGNRWVPYKAPWEQFTGSTR